MFIGVPFSLSSRPRSTMDFGCGLTPPPARPKPVERSTTVLEKRVTKYFSSDVPFVRFNGALCTIIKAVCTGSFIVVSVMVTPLLVKALGRESGVFQVKSVIGVEAFDVILRVKVGGNA